MPRGVFHSLWMEWIVVSAAIKTYVFVLVLLMITALNTELCGALETNAVCILCTLYAGLTLDC